jgi:uncharacterized protein YbaA (DUF1428 family)
MARDAGKVWKKHGALHYFECVGEDLYPKMPGVTLARFTKIAKAKPSETVVFAFIVYKSKAHRNKVNKRVMAEFEKQEKRQKKKMDMPFDVRRMAYGGFRTIVKQ